MCVRRASVLTLLSILFLTLLFSVSNAQRRDGRQHEDDEETENPQPYFGRIQFLFTNIGGKNWWEGPNVCKTKTQDINNVTESDIQRHNIMYSKACDQSETSVKCTTTIVENGEKLIETEVLECCAGWSRKRGDFGCTIEIELVNLVEILEKEGLTEFLSSARAMGLEKELIQGNVTIFAPLNSGFVQDRPDIMRKLPKREKNFPLTNVVIVSKPSAFKYMDDIRSLILSHMVPEVMKSTNMFDDQLIPTGSPFKSSIRINFYNHPVKMMTANCVKVTSPNLQATNGVVHVVEKILNPVSDSLLDHITRHPELSFLKGVIGKVGFVQMLDEDGQMTVFAPTNAAFEKLDKKILAKLTKEQDECSQMILKNHILPNIICSAPIQGHVRTPNLLGQHLKLHRDEDGKLFVNNAQIVVRDIMTTNGVLYLIDDVLVPDGAKTFLEIAEIENADHFVQLVDKAQLTNELNDLKNVTIFLPTNEATQALMNKYPQETVKKGDDLEELKTILRYHIALGALTPKRFYNDKVIDTMLQDDRKLRINEYSMFSFDSTWTHTVQCARISSRPIQTCNGVTYLVDKVLTPPEGDLMHMLSLDKRLTTFVHLLKKSGMADKIAKNKNPLTIFAPTNNAFRKLSTRERERWERDEDAMSSYISESTMCCASLYQGSGWFSRSWRSRPSFHGANIISCDNMATNGVIHITDGVLVSRKRSPQYMGFFDLRNLFME